MPFENVNKDSTSTLLKLQGRPLDYVTRLQRKWEKAKGNRLHKGNAVALLLNNIPRKAIEEAIAKIVVAKKNAKTKAV